MSKKKKRPGAGSWILVALAVLLMCAVLELGKHTLLGWGLAALLIAGFILLKIRVLNAKKRGVRFLGWMGFFAVFAVILLVSWPPVQAVPALNGKTAGATGIVHIAQGDLTGVVSEDGRIEAYTGIPYAKPPVGELRWKEPQEPDAWEGVRACDHFAPMAMQSVHLPIYDSLYHLIGYHEYEFSLEDNYRPPVSEDCLYLNIWKPAGDVSGLPVLVYVHGGSLQTGQPWYGDYSGQGLAREGVVVVNMAYRLGVFGFYADPELAAESPNGTTGNYGLLDQIMALQWVQNNIAAFGGDPSNVTLSGESAGSACVTALCTSPLAKGLFKRVLAESSTVTAPEPAHSFRLPEEAYETAEKTKTRFKASSVADLRNIPAEKLAGEMQIHHHMTVDGYVLPETPYESLAKGVCNPEQIMHGYNRDEAAPFILMNQANLGNYEKKVRGALEEPYATKILQLMPASTNGEARKNWEILNNVVLFTYGHYCLERQALANGIPVYTYYFTKDNGRLGPWHSGEEIYLYGNIPASSGLFDAGDRALSAAMLGYFRNFILSGDPNGSGLPAWRPAADDGKVFEWGENVGYVDAPYMEIYRIMDEMYGFGQ